VQRVSGASVRVAGERVGAIDRGILVLVGIAAGDTDSDLEWLGRKLTALRIFPDDHGKMNLSVVDVGGAALLVSQFTLCADVGKGTRPSFGGAMEPGQAEAMFDRLVRQIAESVPVATGRFGAHMEVELTNDGPVTLWLDSRRGA
jgi:D-tyrosyl-tRNA(Tyr) deacylase